MKKTLFIALIGAAMLAACSGQKQKDNADVVTREQLIFPFGQQLPSPPKIHWLFLTRLMGSEYVVVYSIIRNLL